MNWTIVRNAIGMDMPASPTEVSHPPSWREGRMNSYIGLIL
jgi:hypothetical protein